VLSSSPGSFPGPSLVILISGKGSNLQAIIDATARREIKASITCVISNRDNAKGLEKAKKAGLPIKVIDHKNFENNQAFDHALMAFIDELNPSLLVLAGFMRILSDEFIHHYEGKILNIHPSLLPDFKGLHTHRRVLETDKDVHGASVHFVTCDLDSGPVVLQAEISVLPDDNETSLALRVLQQEHIIYPMAIKWYIEGRLSLKNNQIHLDDKPVTEPAKWKSSQLSIVHPSSV